MKVLAINGSARKDGNTAILVNIIFEELNREGIETEMIQLARQVIEPCKACWGCAKKTNCVHRNDNFQEYFEKMKNADGIILASPVYSANISSNLQAFLERASVISDMHRDKNLFKYKAGASVCALRRGGALNAIDAMNHFLIIQDMFLAGSSYWTFAFGKDIEDVKNDEEGIKTIKNLGINIAYLMKALEDKKLK
ncbi:NADPH-dependent FMN reductase [Brachyspira hampsonii 30446]|uniref:NADPH-dependent FMN reductase n=1 Tax=Brachyspira hampsonii 30446 TaxID=1289135 RepID=A0A2U4FC62_9SPIR|nr:flavodoxin family protein [Brachyspira hampsonii]EKV57044.1 NADPH-dependent FMN reductase [Brachyspira hampsonii 30446]MBW5395760.1 flavodoxin family protein [Brachyspira hampsonii]OEJ19259.1 FMN reductase [Brachyspira hampsonii]